MAKLINSITYQGKPCSGGEYTRSAGLEPDFGFVLMDRQHADLNILVREIPWRPAGGPGQEVPGQISIEAWSRQKGSTVATNPNLEGTFLPPNEAGGKQLAQFGDLVFETDGLAPMRYSDIQIAFSGLEEQTRGYAAQKAHEVGKLRIPITDIRIHYRDRGALFCRINVKMKGGKPDRDSIDGKTKKPHTLKAALRFLFSQLPGSPDVSANSEVFDSDFEQPSPEIIGEGEPAVEHLQRVLDAYGFVPQLLPTNHYALSRRLSLRVAKGKLPTAVGAFDDIKRLRSESKTEWLGNPPPLVMVVGSPVIQRTTTLYEAAFKNTDGLVYRLVDIGQVMVGYSYRQMCTEALVSDDKSFSGVEPKPSAQNGWLHDQRRNVLKSCAFKMYAPAHLFDGEKRGAGNALVINDESTYYSPFLPMVDCPYYEKDYHKIMESFPLDEDRPESDLDGIKLAPPVVRSHSIGAGYFKSIKDVRAYFDAVIERENHWLTQNERLLQNLEAQLREVGKDLRRVEVTVENLKNRRNLFEEVEDFMLTRPGSHRIYGSWARTSDGLFTVDADLQVALEQVGTPLEMGKLYENSMNQNTADALLKSMGLRRQIARLKIVNAESLRKVGAFEIQYRLFHDTYKEYRGVQVARMNLPHGVIAAGRYSVDRRTGILMFSTPHCHLREPFLVDGDSGTVDTDGDVTVTYGYESRQNMTGRLTSVLVGARTAGAGEPGDAAVAVDAGTELYVSGVCRSSPIKAKTIKAAHMQLYKTERGTPMNLASVIATGFELAYGELMVPKKVQGYTYQMAGFHRVVLDGGVGSITHTWDSAHAYTVATVNSPEGRVPGLVAPKFKGKQVKRGAEIRVEIERARA